jgi:hypothetical protein
MTPFDMVFFHVLNPKLYQISHDEPESYDFSCGVILDSYPDINIFEPFKVLMRSNRDRRFGDVLREFQEAVNRLTEGEQKVVALLLKHKSFNDIVDSMHLIPSQVENLLEKASKKLNMVLVPSQSTKMIPESDVDTNSQPVIAIDLGTSQNSYYFDILKTSNQKGQGYLSEPLSPSQSSQTSVEERSRHLDGLIDSLPKDAGYEKKAESLAGLNHEFRQRIAVELAPELNAKIQGMEHETLEQKKELGRWVNEQLEPLGLAVQCPNTGRPAKLRGMTGGSSWPDTGRFCFETHHDGKREKSSYSETLPELMLTDATPTQEPETPWQAKVGPKTRRQDRKRS